MLHRLGAVATATLILLVLVSPIAAANDLTTRGPVTLSGSLEHLHGDAGGREIEQGWHLVKDDGSSVTLDVSSAKPTAADAGKRAQVNGAMKGHKLVVGAGGMQISARSAAAPLRARSGNVTFAAGGVASGASAPTGTVVASTTKRIAILLINFTGNTGQPYTPTQVNDAFFGASPAGSVATFYAEQSYGAWALSGDVFGYYTVAGDLTTCDWSTWGSLARTAATAAGVNLTNYTNVVHLFVGQSTCGWSGLAYLPGTYSFLNGTDSTYVAAHELGHNFGVHHASTTSCTDSGVRVAISATCTPNEYGDPYDVMGGAARLSSTWHRRQEGQLTTADQQTVTTSGTYSVGVAESSSPTAPRIVRVARGDGTYLYLDYHQPTGVFDNYAASSPAVTGVSIRIAPDTALVQSMLVDTTPATSTYTDAPLAVGKSVSDPVAGITITTTSVDANAAVVAVTFGGGSGGTDTIAPSPVGSLAATVLTSTSARLSWTAATDNIGVIGYKVSRSAMTDASAAASPWTDTTLVAGNAYTWTVVAYDAAGNPGPTSSVSVTIPAGDISAPTAVGNLTATLASLTSAKLAWTAATDNVGVKGYRISRAGMTDVNTTNRSWTNSGLVTGTTYTWTVLAYDAAGNLGPATSVSLTILDVIAPTAPTSLTVTNSIAGQVSVRWGSSKDNLRVQGYRVYRDGVLVKTTSNRSWTDVVAAGSHTWWVVAYDASGNVSLPSNTVSLITH